MLYVEMKGALVFERSSTRFISETSVGRSWLGDQMLPRRRFASKPRLSKRDRVDFRN